MDKLMTLCEAMIHYDRGDAKRIHHFLKVHAFAKQIGLEEGLDAETQFILEAAAYVHDIGIHQGEIKYGRNDGMIQQELGPKGTSDAEASALHAGRNRPHPLAHCPSPFLWLH